jgi:hypothetical protein
MVLIRTRNASEFFSPSRRAAAAKMNVDTPFVCVYMYPTREAARRFFCSIRRLTRRL